MNINTGVLDGVRRVGARFRHIAVDGQLAGAPLAMRLMGASTLGPPTAGTWKAGDTVPDRNGNIWTCTTGGTPGTWVPAGGVAAWRPTDDGFLGANSDPAGASGGGTLIDQTLYLARLPVRWPQTITSLWICVSTIGSDTGTGTANVGLVAPGTGTLLSGSGSQVSTFTGTTGWKQITLTTPQAVTGGATPASWPYAVILSHLTTTQVSLLRQNNSVNNSPQTPTSVSQLRWAAQASFGTALANVTLSSNATSAFSNIVLWS